MKSKKDNWQNEVLKSLDGLQQVEPNDALWIKIENRLLREPIRIKMVSKPKIWAAAASIIFLLGINIFVFTQNSHLIRNNSEILVDAYQLNTNSEIQIP